MHCLFGDLCNFRCLESNHWVSGRTLDMHSSDEAAKAFNRLVASISRPVEGLLTVSHAQHIGTQAACSQMVHQLEVYFEKTDDNLEARIATAIERREPLAESLGKTVVNQPVWSVLVCVASALRNLHERGAHHGHVTPRNVLFDSKEVPKLNDIVLSRYFLSTVLPKKRVLLEPPAPRLMGLLRSGTSQLEDFDPSSSDVYSLGLVLYEALTLESPALSYSLQQHTVDLAQIRDNLKAKQGFYSREILQVALDTLTRTEVDRPSAHQVWESALGESKLKVRSTSLM